MGGVSPVLRGSGVPQGSCEVGQHQRGIQEAAMAERGKAHCCCTKETQDVDG